MDFNLTADQLELQKWARNFAKEKFSEKAYTWAKSGEVPWENAKILAEHGLMGMTLPEEDGGQGSALIDAIIVMEEIAKVCPNTADMFQVGNFGAIRQLSAYGSKELKQRVLPSILSGEKLISVAMSEPNAGSAVTDLSTRASIEGDKVIINGSKVFNTHGPHNSYYVVWVRFGEGVKSSGAVLVERDAPGFTVGKTEYHMSGEEHCALYFDHCEVPVGNILVPEDGFRKLFMMFNIERMGNTARSLALGQSAFDLAVEHAKERKQFGKLLAEFQGIQWKVAEMKMKLDAARLLLYRAATNADKGAPSPIESSIAKAYVNTTAFEVAHEAVQIFGGYGYSTDYPLEYIFRRVRGWMIAGGTPEMMKNKIAEDVFGMRFSQRKK
ncbi:acyl-CoA dehydrogenase family protein [Neobacillus sp. OS1-32]|uniref:Acyl-CoA dehydrogenase family protein n=1 Tax=Neobacillus paridis TaxID=2803862 RepID=A0ABS1TXD2_9BACI|nr:MULTISPECIES: acyl-CoA dehydrogenase family protein [Neobacillus]MBL4954941.1 acyl-CoA dehydrogenase family protein [Neobacillus paridis]WML30144.1 acyl-CoA dehydrogenase family protein [Neobacillus sp. OS1-32]